MGAGVIAANQIAPQFGQSLGDIIALATAKAAHAQLGQAKLFAGRKQTEIMLQATN